MPGHLGRAEERVRRHDRRRDPDAVAERVELRLVERGLVRLGVLLAVGALLRRTAASRRRRGDRRTPSRPRRARARRRRAGTRRAADARARPACASGVPVFRSTITTAPSPRQLDPVDRAAHHGVRRPSARSAARPRPRRRSARAKSARYSESACGEPPHRALLPLLDPRRLELQLAPARLDRAHSSSGSGEVASSSAECMIVPTFAAMPRIAAARPTRGTSRAPTSRPSRGSTAGSGTGSSANSGAVGADRREPVPVGGRARRAPAARRARPDWPPRRRARPRCARRVGQDAAQAPDHPAQRQRRPRRAESAGATRSPST